MQDTEPEIISENYIDILVEKIVSGRNVFLHGPGGTGKSYTIRHAVTDLRQRGYKVACTAATGIAAVNLSTNCLVAFTLHKWGIGGLSDRSSSQLIDDISKKCHLVKRWRETNILFIDEISMIGEDFFTKLSTIAKHFRREPDRPFGGLRIVVSGDFLQLPPVKDKWVFTSPAWGECNFDVMSFLVPKRYENEQWFRTLLRIRCGQPSPEDIELLRSRKQAYNDLLTNVSGQQDYIVLPTNLYSTRNSADSINTTELARLVGEECIFESYDEIIFKDEYRSLPQHRQFKTKAFYDPFLDDAIPRKISLKVGAQVMLKWNVDTGNGLANGSRGVVTRIFDNSVEVKWVNDSITVVGPETWEKCDEDAIALRTQIPLVLAWAMTIHKSQGCTLDKVVCDLGKEIFSAGQAYVALSRVRSHEGLYLRSFLPSVIFADAHALEYLGLNNTKQPEPHSEIVLENVNE